MKDAAEVWECRGDCVREEDAQSARQIHISIFSVTGAAAHGYQGTQSTFARTPEMTTVQSLAMINAGD